MKIQKRSESNVLSQLPFKTTESRGYVNGRTQQLLKPLTVRCQGFSFCLFTDHLIAFRTFNAPIIPIVCYNLNRTTPT